MKNLVLAVLIFISFSVFGQRKVGESKETTSLDGRLKALAHYKLVEKGTNPSYEIWESSTIDIYEPTEGGWGKTLDIHDMMDAKAGERYPIELLKFNDDGTILYFSSRICAYLYDIEQDCFKRLFTDITTPVALRDVSGDTLLIRNFNPISTMLGNKFWKYINGKLIPYVPEYYLDFKDNTAYLNGKPCVYESDEDNRVRKMLGYNVTKRL